MNTDTTKKSYNIWQLFISIFLFILGGYILANPLMSIIASGFILGIFLIFIGISYLLTFRRIHSYAVLAIGILNILIGLLFLSNLGLSILTVSIMFALWCLFTGIVQMTYAFELKDLKFKNWLWFFIFGLLSIIFALLIFFNPIIGLFTISWLIGFYLLLYAIFEFITFIKK